jgi:Zn-dependent protease with chaperone function
MAIITLLSAVPLILYRLGTADKLMELFTTHPNMLKRIKHLSTLIV